MNLSLAFANNTSAYVPENATVCRRQRAEKISQHNQTLLFSGLHIANLRNDCWRPFPKSTNQSTIMNSTYSYGHVTSSSSYSSNSLIPPDLFSGGRSGILPISRLPIPVNLIYTPVIPFNCHLLIYHQG